MPEGHSVHRIARQFARNFVGKQVAVSSPQGRFASGAKMIDGAVMKRATAVGKQMFLEFDNGLWLRVHLGLYGAWDFAGEITTDATIRSAGGRMGQTNQRGTLLETDADYLNDRAGEDSVRSIGAPRRARLHMAESEKENDEPDFEFPPPPVGQVRVRLLTDTACADLRGPTKCEVLSPHEVQQVIDRLGPAPLNDASPEAEERVVAAIRRSGQPIGQLLMDQSVVSGIGNVYRAELLFRARQNPFTPGKQVPEETARALWRDWVHLLDVGVRTGQMMTMDDLSDEDYRKAMASRADRHWVYHRTGEPCRVCGTPIAMKEMANRKLYWCPTCQA
ncbi:Fpg/Nei family DNA glycosylase [Gryllotalpicola ginsengisoli]|uniref:Fpg/Nei family DNA glycosylase n=1 Tax=Gryllotalpicola ginsengisoli TaxID=444608 RepID=UPI0003B42757|nr:zinc finger domain-containing protein [Gryllotalpicola ginsengisoli]